MSVLKNFILKEKYLFFVLFVFLIGVFFSQLKFIPSWENIQTVLIVTFFLVALVMGLLFLFRLWIVKDIKISLIHKLIRSSIIIAVFLLGLLVAIPVVAIPDFFKPELIHTAVTDKQTLYIYHVSCAPPDSLCECDSYGSLIYKKNNYFPMMSLVLKTDFYVGSNFERDDQIIVKASDECLKDKGKMSKINL